MSTVMGARWEQRDRQRLDILTAARQRLTDGGFVALTMPEIAEDAGVSEDTIYIFFRGTEDLFATLFAQRLDDFHAEITPACRVAETGEQIIATVATAYLDVYRVFGRELNIWALVLGDHPAANDIAKPLVAASQRVLNTLGAALTRTAKRPVAAGELRLALPFVWATITGLAEHVTGGRQVLHSCSWEQLLDFTARTVIAGLDAMRNPQE
ncbi:MAG: TetR family transcriptional regulator [Actinophytocola sp.]|nr:TetR family transcriptional regulator [Actinophytocola sp.]